MKDFKVKELVHCVGERWASGWSFLTFSLEAPLYSGCFKIYHPCHRPPHVFARELAHLHFPGCPSGWESACQRRTQIQSLVWEDPTCCRATKPMSHNYEAHDLELAARAATTASTCHNYQSPHTLAPALCNNRSHRNQKSAHRHQGLDPCLLQLEKAHAQQRRRSTVKSKQASK